MKHISKISVYLYLVILTYSALAAGATTKTQAAEWQDMVGNLLRQYKLQYLYATDAHLVSNPWGGRFNAVNGTFYNVSQYYKNERLELNLRTGLNIYDSDHISVDLPIHYDNGYKADLYKTDRYVGLGLSIHFTDGKQWAGVLHMFDLVQSGGDIIERPCYDGFRREFHCGTGLAWTDVENNVNGRQIDPSFQFTMTRRLPLF